MPDLPAGAGERRELLARLRAVVEAKDAEVAMLRAELTAERELRRRMELRIAELERRLGQDSTNSGTPTSKESIGARERRKAEREKRDSSERERRKDRKPGGQPGHPGAGLARDPDPEERKTAEPPAQCSLCGAGLAGAQPAGASWAQVWDVSISRLVTARSLLSRRWSSGSKTDRGPWVTALIAAGYVVFPVNPLQASRYRERHAVSGAKSDGGDAHMLADMVRTDSRQLRPAAGDSPEAEGIKVLARTRKTLIWERTRAVQRLRHQLREYFPAALEAFQDLDAPDVLELLAKAPDPDRARRLTRAQVSAALKRARRHGITGKTDAILAALRGRQLGQPAALTAAYAATVRALIAVIATLNEQVRVLQGQVEQHFGRHPDAEIYQSQPGMGAILGARVLAEFGDDPHRYASAKARKNYAATSPITRASGRRKIVAARFVGCLSEGRGRASRLSEVGCNCSHDNECDGTKSNDQQVTRVRMCSMQPEPLSDTGSYPEPLPWMSRSLAMPAMPGAGEKYLNTLHELLIELDRHPHLDAVINWPTPDEAVTVRDATLRLGTCGLVRRSGRHSIELTAEAKHWLVDQSPAYLIAVFHANIRYVGELLQVVASNPQSHEELRKDAVDKYRLTWATLDQVRRRTTWLRAAGVLERRFDNVYIITERGEELLQHLQLACPISELEASASAQEPVELSPPSKEVADLLRSLDQSALARRRAVLGYIPRGSQGNVIDSLRLLVGCAVPTVTRQDFASFCEEHFGIKISSIAATITMLRATGLIEQTGLDTFAATVYAREWLERNDDIELARIIHANVLCFGEVLAAIDYADRATSLTTYSARTYGMPRQDVAGMRTRSQLLHACGLIEEVAYSRYRITPYGEAFRDSIPLLEPEDQAPDRGEDGFANSGIAAVEDRFQQAAAEVVAASTDSDHPVRLESAIADVLRLLGLDAQHVGGSGETDVVAELKSGNEVTRIIIDAKSSAAGSVGEKAINFDTLREHRDDRKADRVAVVGPAFADARLIRRAREHKVSLLPASLLAEAVTRQASTPLGPRELLVLFGEQAAEKLAEQWVLHAREMDLVTRVFEVLAREASDPDQVFGGALTVDQIYLILRDTIDPKPSPKQIEQVLDLLASPLVRGIEQKDRRYFSVEQSQVTATRLSALARAASNAANLLDE